MKIYDGDRLIRTLKQKAPKETGIYKWTWNMDEKGPDRPSRTIRKSKRENGGVQVKPGVYKIVMHFGDQTSEDMISVKSDPRLNKTQSSIDEVYKASKDIESLTQLMADAVKQLVESKNVSKKYQSELKKLDKEKYKDDIKASKDIIKKIDELIALYLGKEDKRQGITRNPEVNINQRIRLANGYVKSRQDGLTSTENTLIEHAKNALKEGLDKTNTFFNNDWKAYKASMEIIDLSPFKTTKSFKLN